MIADIVGNQTLKSQWDETVAYYGSYPFLTFISMEDVESHYTYKEFDHMVKQSANFFLDLGITQGDLVALHLHNRPEYLLCWLALAQIGAVSVPMNEHYQLNESRYIIDKCNIDFLITESRYLDIYQEHFEELNVKRLILVDASANDSYDSHICDFKAAIAQQPSVLKKEFTLSSDDHAVILFTSGTTQYPKGAIYTHANVIYGGMFHASQIGMQNGDRFLTAMPGYHMDFQEMAASPVICSGGHLIMIEHYSARVSGDRFMSIRRIIRTPCPS